MPWEVAKGLLPGRGARSPSPPRPRGMPCEVANGLLPGRGPPGRGPDAPGVDPPGREEEAGASAFGAGRAPGLAPVDGAPADGAAGAAGAEAAGAAGAAACTGAAGAAGACAWGAGALGAAGPGAGAEGRESAAGAGALGAAAGAAGAADLAAASGKALRSFRTTGASMVEEAERTNSPSSCSFVTASLEVIPSSLASSCTRTLATFLLSRSAPSQARTVYFLLRTPAAVDAKGPIAERNKVVIVTHSSLGTHRVSIRFLTRFQVWTVGVAATGAASTFGPDMIQCSTAVVPAAPFRARPNARRLIARARHDWLGCSQAPRPAIRRRSSTRTAVDPLPSATSRSNCDRGPFFRQPMQVRSGRLPVEGTSATVIVLTFTLLARAYRFRRNGIEHAQGTRLPAVRRGPIYSSPFGAVLPETG
jgi:hypothetical protein